MACRYFEESGLARCGAVEGTLTPSLHERERFCHGVPERCRTLVERQRLGRPLSQSLYYSLWIAERAGEEAEAVAP